MADDDRAVMERLAALEAEVKSEADAQSARKAAALAKLRDQRVTQTAERDALRARQAELVGKRSRRETPETSEADVVPAGKRLVRAPEPGLAESIRNRIVRRASRASRASGASGASDDDDLDPDARPADHLENLGSAIELASKANRVKQELARAPRKGEKSWIKSGVASLALGPIGWLYAGSMREAVPATAGWVAVMALAAKILPMFLLMPVLMVALPLSAIAGVVYALQYNRTGGRQRLFDGDKKPPPKQLRSD